MLQTGLVSALLAGSMMMSQVQAHGGSVNDTSKAAMAIDAAVANKNRPKADLLLDTDRKPARVLNFFQVTPGSQVLDVFGGGGYYGELLNEIVGEEGGVTMYTHSNWYHYSKGQSDKRLQGKRLKQTRLLISDINTLELPAAKYDTALVILGLHDLYLESEKSLAGEKLDVSHFLKAIYKSVKPGGVLGIIEHEARAEQLPQQSAQLHRLNSAFIKELMLAAGFVFEADSSLLRNEKDDLTQGVFSSELRRKTDRSMMRFRKVM